MLRSSWKVFDNFAAIDDAIDDLARSAVAAAADEAADIANRETQGKYGFRSSGARGVENGWAATVVSAKWYARFRDRGTLGSYQGKRKRRQKLPYKDTVVDRGTGATRPSGIHATKYRSKARAAGRKRLYRHVQGGLR